MTTQIDKVSKFIFSYVEKYRNHYKNSLTPPPYGAGYPNILKSPYLDASELNIYIAQDGIIISLEKEPPHQWYVFGGPAKYSDYEPSRRPTSLIEHLKKYDLYDKPTPIYRLVSKKPLASCVWRGRLQKIITSTTTSSTELNLSLKISQLGTSTREVLNILTFGVYGSIFKDTFYEENADFGFSQKIVNMGFFPADLNNRRYFQYLKIICHVDEASLDLRLVDLLVQKDLRQDLLDAAASNGTERDGAILSFGNTDKWLASYNTKMESLKLAITELSDALKFKNNAPEQVFHEIIERNPILLDVYGEVESKPEFRYPGGLSSPIGKKKLQPDFIIRYGNSSYKMIEIERPSKDIRTTQGQPRAEVGQAVFQTAEWKHYISTHYNLLSEKYPNIHTKCKTCVIMSRATQQNISTPAQAQEYIGMVTLQYNLDEFLTFDDLLERAITAYSKLTGLKLG
ncbi:Shedu anti-phage system protein SduA domain-containing protein [Pseudomonas sp. Irchel 3E13]|uniref:Shedu anti-phage system protein SduA domain-containing protein n=1 Tax=Pseudomonas sp. Irchel 3E13 TaxID=2008975 RepID=UPI000BA3CF5C|nr:Shedu anti-phage system protein SduA domain-containing protein [Pseudomonas sp. Irchel 3E13]